MAELPAVRRLSREMKAEGYDMLMINIHDETGQVMLERFDFKYTPTFILYSIDGEELWRGNSVPTRGLIIETLSG